MAEDQAAGAELVPVEGDQAGGPEAIVSGSFAVYQGPKGEIILVTEIPGRGVERKVFPKALVRFAMGGPLGAFIRQGKG